MTDTNYTFININERAYKYIRQFTIKSIDDAIIELITNAIDAYNKTEYIERYIYIDVINGTAVRVTDHALGLDADGLQKCFLQLGDYTASDGSRGFFSRGAKDISALGNVLFETIKNNKYSECILNTDAYGMVTHSNIDATIDIRNRINIPDPNNGLSVTLDLLPNFQNIEINSFYDVCCKLGVLRDINIDNKNFIYLRQFINNVIVFDKRVQYVYPKSELLLDIEYTIPNYPDEIARFVVYKSSVPLQQPTKESLLEFGFLVKDDTSIYEVNTINDRFRWNPYINYIYGYVKSNAIKKYLLDYDINGASTNNPYPIIDPSRLTGVNKMHPLIINMLAIPNVRIDLILRELNKSVSSKAVTIEDISDLLDELGKYGLDIIEKEEIVVNFLPNYDGKLIKAINDDRANYVTYEKSYLLAGDFSTEEIQIENYIKEEIIKLNNGNPDNYYYLDGNNNLVQIQNRDLTQTNEPVNILNLLTTEQIDELKPKPYVYQLGNSRNLMKLYIFQKGIIENNTNLEQSILAKTKQFQIEFIDDLNIQERYVIDNTSGIKIKLNLNNPIIRKNLTNKKLDDINDVFKLASISSTTSLVFLKELMADVLSDLILDSDIQNNKVMLDSNNYNNMKKVIEHRNKIMTKVEIPIDNIFQKYISTNTNKKISNITEQVNFIGKTIMDKFANSSNVSDLILLQDNFVKLINSLVE